MTRLLSILLMFFLPLTLAAQVLPRENSNLNYRIVGISFPANGGDYKIEIAEGYYDRADSFKAHIIQTLHSKKNKIISELPHFGGNYTWRVLNEVKKQIVADDFHHFSVRATQVIDTNLQRLRIIKPAVAEKYKDTYIFLDENKVLYDINGAPVWFMPNVDHLVMSKISIRDLKLSPKGTLTFVVDDIGAYEINYNGKLLWKAPNDGKVSGESSESYHHEFTRLSNGHYMILGSEKELWNGHLPSVDSNFEFFPKSETNHYRIKNTIYREIPFGTVIEYDQNGKVVWSWKSSDYFRRSDIYYNKGEGGQPTIDAHENSFFFDEKAQTIYVSFKNISTIIKIKYPEKTVTGAYNEAFDENQNSHEQQLFCNQHSIKKSPNGYLYLYDNNACALNEFPEILKLKESPILNEPLQEIWKYNCTSEGALPGEVRHYNFAVGGNVIELPDDRLFVNMSGTYNKIFIVNPDKEIEWSAMPEKFNAKSDTWNVVQQYRSSIISRSDMEKLIWNAEMTK